MRKVLSFLFIMCVGTFAFAQSAEVVTDILESDEVTYGQVCYLSAVHQGLISDDADYRTLLRNWILKNHLRN